MAFSLLKGFRTSMRWFASVSLVTIMLQITACQSFEAETSEEQRNLLALDRRMAIAADFIDRSRPADALPDLRRMLREYPENSKVLSLNAMAHLALKNTTQAVNLQKTAYELDPSTSMAVTYAGTLIAADYLTQAEKILKSLKTDKNYEFPERIQHNLGYIEEKRGRLKESVNYYEAALQLNPSYFMSIDQLAQVYDKMGNRKKSALAFNRAMALCPTCFEPVNALFHQYLAWENVDQAKTLINQYLRQMGLSDESKNLALKLKKKIDAMAVDRLRARRPSPAPEKKG